MAGIRIGQLLVEQGVMTTLQVQQVLKLQKQSHRPFGDLAERLFGISPKAVEDAWVEQYVRLAGVVDLEQQAMDVRCLRVLNSRQAWQFHLLPVQRDGDELQLATSADKLVRALNFATRTVRDPVFMVIAEREQLRSFLMKHYPVPQYIAQYAECM